MREVIVYKRLKTACSGKSLKRQPKKAGRDRLQEVAAYERFQV